MDFFAQQDHARRKTKLLVFYFVLAVVSMIVVIYCVGGFSSVFSRPKHHYYTEQMPFSFWNPKLFSGVALGMLAVIFIGSAYKTKELSAGGSAVAKLLGGRLVASNTTNPNERKLLNVVEEMSIASGVPMPQVYVLQRRWHQRLRRRAHDRRRRHRRDARLHRSFRAMNCRASSATSSATF